MGLVTDHATDLCSPSPSLHTDDYWSSVFTVNACEYVCVCVYLTAEVLNEEDERVEI